MFRWFRWQLAKRRLADLPSSHRPYRISHARHSERVEDFPSSAERYARLASLWEEYAAWFTRDYTSFLAAAEAYFRQPVEAVLDLACGTGLVTRRLAERAERVVGIDASEAMLRQARSQTKASNVQYFQGDFRDYRPSETFDAAVCSGDSLNYIERPDQLATVFRCVRQNLRPGGLFAFDVLDEDAFLHLRTVKTTVEVSSGRFEHYRFYDPRARVCEDRLVFEDAIEGHRRVPIDKRDVWQAASESGTRIAAHICSRKRNFYLIRMS